MRRVFHGKPKASSGPLPASVPLSPVRGPSGEAAGEPLGVCASAGQASQAPVVRRITGDVQGNGGDVVRPPVTKGRAPSLGEDAASTASWYGGRAVHIIGEVARGDGANERACQGCRPVLR